MAFCRQCGTQIPDDAAFCPSCGANTRAGGNAQRQYQYNRTGNDIEDNKMISILCYFWILFLIPYFTRPDSEFVKFHSNQGLVLFLFSLVSGAVAKIPVIGWPIGWACGIFGFVCFILGIVNVCNGEMKELPLIGELRVLK